MAICIYIIISICYQFTVWKPFLHSCMPLLFVSGSLILSFRHSRLPPFFLFLFLKCLLVSHLAWFRFHSFGLNFAVITIHPASFAVIMFNVLHLTVVCAALTCDSLDCLWLKLQAIPPILVHYLFWPLKGLSYIT